MSDFITREGMLELKKKLQRLKEERPEIIKQVVTAREMGDLKENAEYHAAREKQRHIDNEISRTQIRLNRLKVVDPTVIPKDAVRFGACIRLKDVDTGENYNYRIVGIDEVDLLKDKEDTDTLSIESPIGKSLIGKKVGEVVSVKVPAGERKFEILLIK